VIFFLELGLSVNVNGIVYSRLLCLSSNEIEDEQNRPIECSQHANRSFKMDIILQDLAFTARVSTINCPTAVKCLHMI